MMASKSKEGGASLTNPSTPSRGGPSKSTKPRVSSTLTGRPSLPISPSSSSSTASFSSATSLPSGPQGRPPTLESRKLSGHPQSINASPDPARHLPSSHTKIKSSHRSSSSSGNGTSSRSSNKGSISNKNRFPAPCPNCEKARTQFKCATCLTHFKNVYHQKRAGALKDLIESRQRVSALLGPLKAADEEKEVEKVTEEQKAATGQMATISESILGRWPAIPGSYLPPATAVAHTATTPSSTPPSSPSHKRPSGLRRLLSIPDPFGDYDDENQRIKQEDDSSVKEGGTESLSSGASHAARDLRADRASLQLEILEMKQLNASASKAINHITAQSEQKRAQLDRRKSMLTRARHQLLQANDGRSKERYQDGEGVGAMQMQHRLAQAQLAELQSESEEVAKELAKARARRTKEAFALFQVRPPSGSLARLSSDRQIAATPSRNQRSRERYMSSGIFDLAALNSAAKQPDASSAVTCANPNDWTIVELVLPVVSDLRRFERDNINGAVSHTVHLLHLLADYLGIILPFSVSDEGGKLCVFSNPLYPSVHSTGEMESLSLTQEAHASLGPAMSGPSASSTSRGLGASMMESLTASTMWTLDSFVSVKRFNGADGSGEGSGSSSNASGGASVASSSDSASISAKEFRSALTKIAYNAAYLAHIQGARVELVHAAGSSLRLLSKATLSKLLGKTAHTTYHNASHARDLSFPGLELSQLQQINEKDSGGSYARDGLPSVLTKPKKTSASKAGSRAASRGSKDTERPMLLEESYVDARQAAESILISDANAQKGMAETRMQKHKEDVAALPKMQSSSKRASILSSHPPSSSTTTSPAALRTHSASVLTTPDRRRANIHDGTHGQADKLGSLNFLKARGAKARAEAVPLSPSSSSKPKEASAGGADQTKPSQGTPSRDPAIISERPREGTVTFNGVEIRAKSSSTSSKHASGGRKGSNSSAIKAPSLLSTRPYRDARRARDGLAQVGGHEDDDEEGEEEEEEWDVVEHFGR